MGCFDTEEIGHPKAAMLEPSRTTSTGTH